ncbi:MAG: MFS transporter [Eubacteriales bacterium]
MAGLLLAVIYLGFISLGLPDSLNGSAWPVMHEELGVSLSSLGIVTMLISGSTIVSSLVSDKLTRRMGTYLVTVMSVLLTCIGIMGFSLSTSFWMLCLFTVPYGFGAGAIDAALNNYIALHFSSRHMNWLHCFWGVGTIISPNIMWYCLTASAGWRGGFRAVGFIQLALFLVIVLSYPLWRNPPHLSGQEEVEPLKLTLFEKLKRPGAVFLLLSFFCYCAAEATVMYWASTYLATAKAVEKSTAAECGSLFFIGMTVGRFLSGFVSQKLGDRRLMRVGIGVAGVGILLLFLPLPLSVTIAAFVIIGLGCAPIYPAIIHSTPANFGAEASSGMIGLEMACAYVGSTCMPPVYGLLAEHLSPAVLPLFLTVFLGLHLLFMELLNRKKRRDAARAS